MTDYRTLKLMYNKIDHTIRFGAVTSTSLDSNGNPVYQIQKSTVETHSNIPIAQPEGFASRSISGISQSVILNQSGDNNRGVVIATMNPAQVNLIWQSLNEGEVCIYTTYGQKIYLNKTGEIIASTANGESIILNNAGTITINSNSSVIVNTAQATITANQTTVNGSATFNGSIQVNGGITSTGDVIANGISLDQHIHHGVQPGTGSTAGPSG